MTNVIPFPAWDVRKEAGDNHEQRVRAELRRRLWFPSKWGQELLDDPVKAALQQTDSPLRREPDIIAARGGDTVVGIDCKGSITGNGRYNINRKSLAALRMWSAYHRLPLYLVVSDLNVITPDEAMAAAGVTHLDTAGAYLRVPRGTGRPFDAVFGPSRAVAQIRRLAA